MSNKKVIIANLKDDGELTEELFKLVECPIPTDANLKDNEVCVQVLYFAIEPYLRGRMRTYDSYTTHAEEGEPLGSFAVARVHATKSSKWNVGDLVWAFAKWEHYSIINENSIFKKIEGFSENQLTYYLHVLGMPGQTAYVGLYGIGQPKKGETVLVSNASSTVSLTVAELAHVEGCRTVGITSTAAKATKLKETKAFDEIIVMEEVTINGLTEALKKACPKGIDIYFDNVGGEISDLVIQQCNPHARIPVCGAISQYNSVVDTKLGRRLWLLILEKRVRIEGFINGEPMWRDVYVKALTELPRLFKENKLTPANEVILDGIEKAPTALIDLYKNKFHGKLIVKNKF